MLYKETEANFPRLQTDTFFVDYNNEHKYNGVVDKIIKFIEEFQLLDTVHWKRFSEQFSKDTDGADRGWRGEYWGKMMRGACFVYSYTKNKMLYDVLYNTVNDMIENAGENGRISAYGVSNELDGWDLWCRKYVLLGMQYFMEICDDGEMNKKIVKSMCGQVDYLIEKIGSEEGKKEINAATRNWRGLNSSSILEPVVRLYTITKEQRYFDFAKYIVDRGGTEVVNIFKLAYEDGLYPYQYPVTKAYEMISCFEGLLEFYRVTGEEWYKTAVINFANKILESDFTIIGSCGCTHELFDHSTVRQANTNITVPNQETCVTVTIMKFMYQLTLLTGNPKYVDAFEISMYNAYFGAVNTEKAIDDYSKSIKDLRLESLPFDSYSPLVVGKRGTLIGGFKIMEDNYYYGCCACIGSAGAGLIPKMALLTTKKGFAYNLFIDGSIKSVTPKGNEIVFVNETDYPKGDKVKVCINLIKSEKFEIALRNPVWSKTTKIVVSGKEIKVNNGYVLIEREWKNGDVIEINLDMRTEAIRPIPYGEQVIMSEVVWELNYVVPVYDKEDPLAKNHIALRRGPVILAQENRLGYNPEEPVEIKINNDGYVDTVFPDSDIAPYEHIIEMKVPLTDGKMMTVTDYGSAGKLWTEENKMAAWILTK